jgi:hypothetical protein
MLRSQLNPGNAHALRPLDLMPAAQPGVACLSEQLDVQTRAGSLVPAGIERRTQATGTQPVTPRLICLVAVARSGTNHLASVLSMIPQLDVRHEIFHKTRCQMMHPHELAELSRRSGRKFPASCENAAAVSAVRARPDLVMDCLTNLMAPEKSLVYFKVFRLQLTPRQVRNAIIKRPDTIVMFLRRRPIDTFISLRKALNLQHWYGRDTTELKISIDADDFIGWWGRTSAWFRKVEAACWAMGKPFHRLSYETDINVPAEQALERFREILASHGLADMEIGQERALGEHHRQDRNTEIGDRVANWPEFRQRLGDKGFLEKAFSPFPNYEPTAWDRFRLRLGV